MIFKRILIPALVMFVSLDGFSAVPDEGMWLPLFVKRLNYSDMKKAGLKLSADEIYNINHSSLKDAVVSFGGFCTGEIISPEGLLLTNHHCGFDAIQSHSTVEHDYLTDGFWAMDRSQELPVQGLTVSFVVRIEDVTKRVNEVLKPDMTEQQRAVKIKEVGEKIKNEAEAGTHYNAAVKPFFEGNEFYLFVYETYKDVRLVGAPPSSIGKFGGDTDNWMWPRHTGDFSMFRVYAGPDGKPAEYSKNNIPLKPRKYLSISMAGIKKNEYAMIMGFPGKTNRYMTSYGVQLGLDQSDPATVKIRGKRLSLMKEDMETDKAVRIKYDGKYAEISNYWKYFIGQSQGLKRLHVVDKKKKQEAEFMQWVNADTERKTKYGNLMQEEEGAYKKLAKYNLFKVYYGEAVMGSEILSYALKFNNLYNMLKTGKASQEELKKLNDGLKVITEAYFKDYNAPTDKKISAAMLDMFRKDIPKEFHPHVLSTIEKDFGNDFSKFFDDVFAKSIFVSQEKVASFLNNPDAKILENDPAFKTAAAFFNFFISSIVPELVAANAVIVKNDRLFVQGLREMNPQVKYYPNANSTLRLTYGKVLGYKPRDAVFYELSTTLQGVLEKEDPDNTEFIVPTKLKELYQKKDFGRYGKNGKLPVNFITNTDITGGNSGSPVINAKGELIGLAFDGNWEAMSGDIAFEPELQRTISVDIRYVLFIIDKFAGAGYLLNELTLLN